ncbi:MAG: chromosomal replication initiator protein DnaA [Ignavibacterium sp.]
MINSSSINPESSLLANNSIISPVDKAKEVWNDCLKTIKDNVPYITYNTWFLPLKPIEVKNNKLKIQLPGNLFYDWIEEHYNTLINIAIKKALGNNGQLEYIIVEEPFEDIFEKPESTNQPTHKNNNINSSEKLQSKIEINSLNQSSEFETFLNPKYTFDNFIKGEGNQLARAAAGAISENPGETSFNPFFVYGGVGLGKTHLIQAIGNEIVKNLPNKKVIYISADHFTVEFVESIKDNRVNEFSNFYRSMDVLIIDDIQFLTGKEKTQDLFFHIFNTLHQLRKQIILTSDKPPKDLKGVDERLISRFHWGLTADIQPPDLETRIAILRKKTEDYGMTISGDIIDYIANNITSNIRELEGCLIKLLANASLTSKEIDFDLAKRTVREISTSKKPSNISIDLITNNVCQYLQVDENKIRDKTRKQEIVFARQLCMYFSKELTKMSLKNIGLHFGGRDHSTVIHACTTIEELIEKDQSIKETVDTIKNKIELSCI